MGDAERCCVCDGSEWWGPGDDCDAAAPAGAAQRSVNSAPSSVMEAGYRVTRRLRTGRRYGVAVGPPEA